MRAPGPTRRSLCTPGPEGRHRITTGSANDDVAWQGFHHVALVTADLDATVRFYGDVLGMEVGGIMSRDARGGETRHCFVRPGGAGGWGLHFFESRDAGVIPETGDMRSRFGFDSVGPHHVAFGLPDEAAGVAFRERLERNGVEATPIGDAGPVRNTLFLDNNGLLLEAAWPRT